MGYVSDEFLRGIEEFSKRLIENDNFLVVSHHDADGITACAIIVDALRHHGKKVEFQIMKQLDSTTIGTVNGHDHELQGNSGHQNTSNFACTIVFTDMGSGQLDLLEKTLDNFYIIDHHPPLKEHERQINPHFFGYDGGCEVSGAGMAYFVAKALGRTNMADIAVVGAVGDMQDSTGALKGVNRQILEDAQMQGTILVENDIRMFGRQSRTLTQMLAYNSDPFLPGLTGDEIACAHFVRDLCIELEAGGQQRSYVSLSGDEKQKLVSAIYTLLVDSKTPDFIIHGMFGEVYTLLREQEGTELRDAKEFATMMNACGRQDMSALGVHVCLGDRGVELEKALKVLKKHRDMLRSGINYLKTIKVNKAENFCWFDATSEISENIVGIIAGMAYSARIAPTGMPIIALADDKDDEAMKKVSARANWGLVRSGIHLGNAMRDCSTKVGGEGGGHNIAAGARIPKDKKDEFLKCLDKMFGEQKRELHTLRT